MLPLTKYSKAPYSLMMSGDGKIVVQPGDSLSKYSWVFYGNYTTLDQFERWNAPDDTTLPIQNKNLINVGEVLVWLPAYNDNKKRPGQPPVAPVRPNQTYDRHAAARYARRWAKSHNPDFERAANDSTNFVSQALWAGGWPMTSRKTDTSDRDDKNVWWYGKGEARERGINSSRTWTDAQYFNDFLRLSGRGHNIFDYWDSRYVLTGDVMQVTYGLDVIHTMIVTGNIYPVDKLVTYHSSGPLSGKGLCTNEQDVSLLALLERVRVPRNVKHWRISETIS